MKDWTKAWSFSFLFHCALALVVAFIYSYYHEQTTLPLKGISIHIGGRGYGQGGAFPNTVNDKRESDEYQKKTERASLSQQLLADALDSIMEQKEKVRHEEKAAKTADDVGQQTSQASASSGQGQEISGLGKGKGKIGEQSGQGEDPRSIAGYTNNGDGTYTAERPDGLSYRLIKEVAAKYPEEAKEAQYTRSVVVMASFLVGTDGHVESVQILNQPPELGFAQAVKEALSKYEFEPITYKGYPIKVRFTKRIRFDPN